MRWEDVDLTEGFIRVRGRQAKRTDGRTKSVRVSNPYSVFKGNVRYAVTEDEMEVPYVVRARIEKS